MDQRSFLNAPIVGFRDEQKDPDIPSAAVSEAGCMVQRVQRVGEIPELMAVGVKLNDVWRARSAGLAVNARDAARVRRTSRRARLILNYPILSHAQASADWTDSSVNGREAEGLMEQFPLVEPLEKLWCGRSCPVHTTRT